ncbi:MAG: enoyl-CoA hydratase-related protein [Clostridiales bacterium]|nr:enoyl-CoA hydratase-related protein [Clostridiales bacterium]
MEFKNFLYEMSDGVVVFTVNRPEVRNALNTECWEEIGRFVDQINMDQEVKLAIITGAGEKAFVAGADISAIKQRTMVDALTGIGQNVLRRLAACEKPVIAAVNGLAFGGGCELAMACDIRIASENAKFGLPELGLGIIPGAGGTQRLAKLVGLGRAKEMILTGRAITAQEALQMGLVTKVTPPGELMAAVGETAKAILAKGPLAVRLAKKAVAAALSTDEESGMLLELLSYTIAVASEDRTEGATAFLEKRVPDFQGK